MSRGISFTLASIAFFVLISSASSSTPNTDTSFETCLRKDSISCVQIHVYKKLRALFSKDTIDLLAGFRLVKGDENGRSAGPDREIYETKNVIDRQSALEDYIYDQMTNFFQKRSFQWDAKPAMDQASSTARMVMDNLPKDVKEDVSSYIEEGRGKRKVLKSLIPVLIAAKLKFLAFLKIAYIVTALMAKKALIISTLALAITLFITIRKLLSKNHHHHPHHYEVHGEAYHSPIHHPISSSGGWNSNSNNNGWNNGYNGYDSYDLHSMHSQPSTSHHLAYSSQKPTIR